MLHDGLRRHHPGVAFHVALCDDPGDIETDAFPFTIVPVHELGIPDLAAMAGRYSITELNTSVKPYVFSWLFDRFPGRPVVYFDPDIAVLSPLNELQQALEEGADCVLTPHVCEPSEFAEMHEGRMLNFGVYNLGFCALRDTPEVRRVLAWWARRLERECVIDLPAGLFVDQKWADLLPAFIARTAVLRHPGYNAAYWNLSQRTVRRTGQGWQINGQPLRFFHFSGSVVDEPVVFSRHSTEFRLETLRDVAALFADYVQQVHRFGRNHYRTIPYAFSWNGASVQNLHTPAKPTGLAPGRAGGIAAGCAPPNLPLLRARSLEEYRRTTAQISDAMVHRRALEATLIPPGRPVFSLDGHCVVCGTQSTLRCSLMYSTGTLPDGRQIPNWREHLDCRSCGFTNRLRACLHLASQERMLAPGARIYLTEQVTPLFDWVRARFPDTVGSEYLRPDCPPGAIVNGVRHEDVQRLSFPDGSFDLILSFEVLEHVPHEKRAFAELARCLKPSGTLFITVPFRDDLEAHEVRALLREDGTIQHLMPAEYHGNPVDREGGALCFRYYGWRLLDDLREAGFSDAEVWFYWSRRYGYLGNTNSIIVARR